MEESLLNVTGGSLLSVTGLSLLKLDGLSPFSITAQHDCIPASRKFIPDSVSLFHMTEFLPSVTVLGMIVLLKFEYLIDVSLLLDQEFEVCILLL